MQFRAARGTELRHSFASKLARLSAIDRRTNHSIFCRGWQPAAISAAAEACLDLASTELTSVAAHAWRCCLGQRSARHCNGRVPAPAADVFPAPDAQELSATSPDAGM